MSTNILPHPKCKKKNIGKIQVDLIIRFLQIKSKKYQKVEFYLKVGTIWNILYKPMQEVFRLEQQLLTFLTVKK